MMGKDSVQIDSHIRNLKIFGTFIGMGQFRWHLPETRKQDYDKHGAGFLQVSSKIQPEANGYPVGQFCATLESLTKSWIKEFQSTKQTKNKQLSTSIS